MWLLWTATSSGPFSVTFAAAGPGYSGPTVDNVVLTAVPEPSSLALALAGLSVMGFAAKRRSSGRS